ncbi:MAG: tetratricopeptide repeat protein, partial [Acidobacteria bacterium]|nr:tetratricopeptide repeat protein [Acidobacteriota bacterium]
QLGGVEFAEHRFSEAATSAGRALKLQPDDPSAIALEGDAQLELGNYSNAENFFSQLTTSDRSRPHKGLEYLNATRRASLAWMHGDVSQSLSLMRSATELAIEARLPAENVAWTYFTLGEQLFQSGKLNDAEAAMREALDAYPSYHRALAGMGQIRAAQQRFSEAAGFYKQAQDVVPLPIYAAALGDLHRKMGKGADAEKQYALVEFIGQLSAIHKQVYNRELALFYADHDRHLGDALELARKELELRHDVFTWDALAWALVKNGKVAEARDPMAKALALGTRDPLLFFHAAALEHASGNSTRCAEYARRALELNPEFHVIYAQQARDWASPAGREAVTAYAAR